MSYTILSAAYANEESTAALIHTKESGAVLASESDTPELWQAMLDTVTPKGYAADTEAAIKAQIDALEATITPRRLREAVMGNSDSKAFISDADAKISSLRSKLKS